MKKKILIFTGLLTIALIITAIAIPKKTYQKWFGKIPSTELPSNNTTYQRIFVVNDKNKLVGVKVFVDKIEEDEIRQKWNLLTSSMGLIPSGYSSPITPTSILDHYEVEGQKLVLYVSDDILRSAGKLATDSLAWTFCNDDIKEVIIKVDDQQVTTINDYRFKKISKNVGVNFTYETSYLLEADYSTIVYYQNDNIYPVTYFYDHQQQCDFMINKIINSFYDEQVVYEYEYDNHALVIEFKAMSELNELTKNSLEQTVLLNLNVDKLTINGNDITLYEKTFVEVKN